MLHAVKDKGFNETCGGSYGELGRCSDGYRCTVEEDLFLKEGKSICGICLLSKL